MGKHKKKVWIDGLKKGDRILDARFKKPLSGKTRWEVVPLKGNKRKEIEVSVQNLGLLGADAAEGTLLFRVLRVGGKVEVLDLDLLVMGKGS
jgi:hypothetical protein